MASEQRPEGRDKSCVEIWRKTVPGRGKSKECRQVSMKRPLWLEWLSSRG